MLVPETAGIGALARRLQFHKTDQRTAGGDGVVWAGPHSGQHGFAHGDHLSRPEMQNGGKIAQQRFEWGAHLILGRSNGAEAGQLGFQRPAEAGRRLGEQFRLVQVPPAPLPKRRLRGGRWLRQVGAGLSNQAQVQHE